MEHINCIFCDIPNSRVVIEENGYRGVQCDRCGLIYISPRPSLEDIRTLYTHDSAHVSAQAQRSADITKRLYANHTLDIIAFHRRHGSLLEIGSGPGFFLEEARKRGFTPYGIEFNVAQAEFIRQTLDMPCEEAPVAEAYPNRTFDIIYHCDVLSHFYDPIAEFKAIHGKLKDDGLLVFESGNFADTHPVYFRYLQAFQYPDHLFFFGLASIKKLLHITGFECLHIYSYSIMPQLIAARLIGSINTLRKRLLSATPPSTPPAVTASQQSSSEISRIRRWLRRGYAQLDYLLRYKIGTIAPRQGRLQTLIVVARKRNTRPKRNT